MTATKRRRVELTLVLALALAACHQPQTPTESEYFSGAGASGNASQGGRSGGASGGMGALGDAGEAGSDAGGAPGACDPSACFGSRKCCAEDETCGVVPPSEMLEVDCVSRVFRGGTITSACPSSPEYCLGTYCQTFQGCRQEGDDLSAPCGYWVEGWTIAGGEEAIVTEARLGCVPAEDFVVP